MMMLTKSKVKRQHFWILLGTMLLVKMLHSNMNSWERHLKHLNASAKMFEPVKQHQQGFGLKQEQVEDNNENDVVVPILRPENLAIVHRAPRIDLAFVPRNLTLPGNANIGQGARRTASDAYGTYIPDVTLLHQNPPLSLLFHNMTANETRQFCQQHGDNDEDYLALQRLRVASSSPNSNNHKIKILCVVYSVSKGHHKIPLLRETWGHRCDGFFVGSDRTDESLGAVDIQHDGKEAYRNMWQKVRSMWAFIYDHYYNDFDWFHMGGDDMWIIVENLRAYLESDEIRAAANGGILPAEKTTTSFSQQIPLYLGQPLGQHVNATYNTGGPGYTLNKAALKLLATQCIPFHETHRLTSAEDAMVAECLRALNVTTYWTMDEHGGHRYHHFPPGRHYVNTEPKFFKTSAQALNYTMGHNFSSPYSISFHYINKYNPSQMRRLHALAYGPCKPAVIDRKR